MTETYEIPFKGNRYCGPAALAYVTRSNPDIAARLLRQVSGKRKIIGTDPRYMRHALNRAGLHMQNAMPTDTRVWSGAKRLTVKQWYQGRTPHSHEEFIVNITGHYIVIHGDHYFDNKCHLGKPMSKCPYLRCRVKRAWLITGVPQVPIEAVEKPKTAASKLRQLEKKYGVIIVDAGDDAITVEPNRNHHIFPSEQLHMFVCSDLADVRARIEKPVPCDNDCDCRI